MSQELAHTARTIPPESPPYLEPGLGHGRDINAERLVWLPRGTLSDGIISAAPVSSRAAREVSRVLRHVPDTVRDVPQYSFYI
jgi:hypothetical protein